MGMNKMRKKKGKKMRIVDAHKQTKRELIL